MTATEVAQNTLKEVERHTQEREFITYAIGVVLANRELDTGIDPEATTQKVDSTDTDFLASTKLTAV